MSACKSCGAELIWATTTKGKKVPLDADPVPNGKFILEGDETDSDSATATWIGEKDPYQGPRYVSHFDTCPEKERWEGGGRSTSSRPARPAAAPRTAEPVAGPAIPTFSRDTALVVDTLDRIARALERVATSIEARDANSPPF